MCWKDRNEPMAGLKDTIAPAEATQADAFIHGSGPADRSCILFRSVAWLSSPLRTDLPFEIQRGTVKVDASTSTTLCAA